MLRISRVAIDVAARPTNYLPLSHTVNSWPSALNTPASSTGKQCWAAYVMTSGMRAESNFLLLLLKWLTGWSDGDYELVYSIDCAVIENNWYSRTLFFFLRLLHSQRLLSSFVDRVGGHHREFSMRWCFVRRRSSSRFLDFSEFDSVSLNLTKSWEAGAMTSSWHSRRWYEETYWQWLVSVSWLTLGGVSLYWIAPVWLRVCSPRERYCITFLLLKSGCPVRPLVFRINSLWKNKMGS